MLAKLRQFLPFLPGGPTKASPQQVLGLRPLRNPAVKWEREGDENLVVIRYTPKPFEGRPRFIDRFFGLPSEKRIELTDELSSAVWEQCDGKHTVAEIAGFISKEYKLGRRQAEVSVLAFLKTLQTKRLVGVPIDQARELIQAQKGSGSVPKPSAAGGNEGYYAGRKIQRRSKTANKRAQ